MTKMITNITKERFYKDEEGSFGGGAPTKSKEAELTELVESQTNSPLQNKTTAKI